MIFTSLFPDEAPEISACAESILDDWAWIEPAQFWRDRRLSGEQALCLEVLVDAFECAAGRRSFNGGPLAYRAQAIAWFAHAESGRVSLRHVCDLLDLDIERIQRIAASIATGRLRFRPRRRSVA